MAKELSAADMYAKVKACFDHNKTANTLIVTSDGTCFLEKDESAAERHARVNKLESRPVHREQLAEVDEAIKKSEGDAGSDATDLDPKYGKMKLDELKAECTKREIAFDEKATKKQLILTLEAADEAK